MNIKYTFYIWRNKKYLYNTQMVFSSRGKLNYPLILFIEGKSIWDNMMYAVNLLTRYKGYVLLDEKYLPFWIFMGGEKSVVNQNIENVKESIYISFSDSVSPKEKYYISRIKSKYRFSFNWYDYPYTNIVPTKNALKNVFNITLLNIDLKNILDMKDNEDSIFVDKQNKNVTRIVERFKGNVYFNGIYWKGNKRVIYVNSGNMIRSLVISKKRFLSDPLLISFCEHANLRYERI